MAIKFDVKFCLKTQNIIQDKTVKINISNLNSGMYLVSIVSNKGSISKTISVIR